jgi:hypothetical protein
LGTLGGGAGIGIGFAQAFQEVGDAGCAAGEYLETGGAGGVPLLVGKALEVRRSSERRDGAKQFARADGDVQRKIFEVFVAVPTCGALNYAARQRQAHVSSQ